MTSMTGWSVLVRFVVRRDRLRLGLWLVGLAAVIIGSGLALPATYPDQAAIDRYVELVGSNVALVAFAGPGYGFDRPNIGVVLVNEIQVFAFIGVALMSIFLIVHGTRTEEDSERADLLRSNVVGRHAPTAAVVFVVAVSNLLVGASCLVGFWATGYEITGSVALVASIIAVGWVFVGVAVVAAQVMSTARGALGVAGAALGLSFVIRAVGDIGDNGVSWGSPLGWAQAVRAFAAERWWTLGLCLVVTAGLLATGLRLENHRDLGAGLVPPRLGSAQAPPRHTTPIGFALRLQRASITVWAVGMFALGAVFGSLAGDIEAMVEDNEVFADVFVGSGSALVDSYLATTASMLALVTAGFAVASALRPRSEESAGRAEQILATRTSRRRWLGSHLLVTVVGTVVVQAAGGLGAGVATAVVSGADQFPRVVGATLVMVPAILVVVGLAVAAYGIASRFGVIAWVAVAFMAVVGYLGRALRFPDWTRELSPMEHVPQVPAVALDVAPLAVMCLTAVALTAVGMIGFGRRDIAAA